MCGIAGKVSSVAPIAPGLIEAMCERQVHRGPDSRGVHTGDGVALGIQRLRVIDLETGDQPIYNEDRSVAVLLNGEIYNYRELRRELVERGHRFATESDTEVIAHLYEERGRDLVHALHGMFAFALWDDRERRLLLARDRVGKKPLFYACGDGWLAFASELGALMADEQVPRTIDPSSVDCYLAYGYIPAPWSIWEDVRKLPPAHTLTWQEARIETHRYWTLDYSTKVDAEVPALEAELRHRVAEAVRRRTIADVPLGAFLSGGVDSSVVVAEMASQSSQPVKTFSIGFDEARFNELPRARVIAERFGTDHHEFVVKPNAVDIVPRIARRYGEPFGDSSAIPSFYLSALTRRHVTVALNGDGGDESFGGYLRHVFNDLTAGIDRLPVGARRMLKRAAGGLRGDRDAKGGVEYARRFLATVDLPFAERYASHVSVFHPAERQALLTPDFRAGVDASRASDVILQPWRAATGSDTLDILLEVDVNTHLPGDLLTKFDIASMAHSLEARSPLLDHTVMEFAASVPASTKASRLRRKRLLRTAYRDVVPSNILRGRKMGFAVPLGKWLRGELRGYARELLLDGRARSRDFVSRDVVEQLLASHDARDADHSGKLWTLMMLELWHQDPTSRSSEESSVA